MMKVRTALVLATMFMMACSGNDQPKGVLKPDKMEAVLWDYISADAFTTDFISKDSSKNLSVENVKLQKAIFAKHKITKDEFYNSYNYYESHPDKLQALLDTMILRKRRTPDDILKRGDTLRSRKIIDSIP